MTDCRKHILPVDDSSAQCELLTQAFAQHGSEATMHIQPSVDASMGFLDRCPGTPDAVFPALVLVDLKLSGGSCLDLLRLLRVDRRYACLPVVMFTTSDDPQDIRASYKNGANGYVVKPPQFDLVRLTADLCRYWWNWNEVAV